MPFNSSIMEFLVTKHVLLHWDSQHYVEVADCDLLLSAGVGRSGTMYICILCGCRLDLASWLIIQVPWNMSPYQNCFCLVGNNSVFSTACKR